MADPPRLSPYAGYDVLQKWDSPSFDGITRQVIEKRLRERPERRFLSEEEFRLVEVACARLLATEPGAPPIACWIDADLFEGRGEGFRHPEMPPAREAWRKGIAGVQAVARGHAGHDFVDLAAARQRDVLDAVQRDRVDRALFGGMSPSRFFTHLLLKAAASHFYSHPDAWSEIGFGGPASPRGYVRIGLDARDPWEARRR